MVNAREFDNGDTERTMRQVMGAGPEVGEICTDPAALRRELDDCDEALVRLIVLRGRLARRLAEARMDRGDTGFVHDQELAAVRRYRRLGPAGADLAVLLLRLARRS